MFLKLQKVEKELPAKCIRVELDDSSETISAKTRDAQVAQVPYMAVVGDKEIESESVAVRSRDGGKQEVMTTTMFIEKLLAEIEQKK